jgi:hypothetical protein
MMVACLRHSSSSSISHSSTIYKGTKDKLARSPGENRGKQNTQDDL